MRSIAAALTVLMLGSAVAGATEMPTIRNGTPYGKARQQMIAAGFDPVPQERSGNRCFSFASICAAYTEVTACLNRPAGPCRFEWLSATGKYGAFIETRGPNAASIVVIKSYTVPVNDAPTSLEQDFS